MKTRLFILSLAALSLAACNNTENLTPDAPQTVDDAIVFGVKSELTKAVSEANLDVLKANGFKVAAVTSTPATMFNAPVSWVTEKNYFSTENKYFWPTTGTMSFYAAYPSSQVIDPANAKMSYTSNGTTDLLAESVTGATKPSSQQPQSLQFDHILSQFVLNAKGKTDGVVYRIKSVKVASPQSGDWSFTSGAWGNLGQSADMAYFSGTKDVQGVTPQLFTEAVTVIPLELTITIEYDVLDKNEPSIVYASYSGQTAKTAHVTPTIGKKCTVNATLPFDGATELNFTVTVSDWGTESKDVEFE